MATISENVVPATGLEQDPESSLIYKEVFGLCDRDANGFISKDELAHICKQVSDEEVASSVLDNVMSCLDKDHDGLISFEEFKAGFQVFQHSIQPDTVVGPAASSPSLHKRSPVVELYESDPVPDADEAAWVGVANRLDPQGVLVGTGVDTVWKELNQRDPGLLENFEGFLTQVVTDLKQSDAEKSTLQNHVKRMLEQHNREVSEMDHLLQEELQLAKANQQETSATQTSRLSSHYSSLLAEREAVIEELATHETDLKLALEQKTFTESQLKQEKSVLLTANKVLKEKLETTLRSDSGSGSVSGNDGEHSRQLSEVGEDDRESSMEGGEADPSPSPSPVYEMKSHARHGCAEVTTPLALNFSAGDKGEFPDGHVMTHQNREQGTSHPSQGTSHPSQGTSHSSQETSHSSQGTSHPSQGTSHPSQGTSHPSQGTSHPSQGTSHPSQGTSHPSQGTSHPSQGTSHPSQGTTYPLQGTSHHPLQGTSQHGASHSNGFALSGRRDGPSTGHSVSRVFKVIFLGDSGVGKSSLIAVLSEGQFSSSIQSTVGLDYTITTLSVGEERVVFQLWDTAGQERFNNALTPVYFRRADAFVIVYDVSDFKSFKSIKKWISIIKAALREQPPIVMVVGNKTDRAEQRCVAIEDGRNLALELQTLFSETSALSGDNVVQAHSTLAQLLLARENADLQEIKELASAKQDKCSC